MFNKKINNVKVSGFYSLKFEQTFCNGCLICIVLNCIPPLSSPLSFKINVDVTKHERDLVFDLSCPVQMNRTGSLETTVPD
jgi:hypothetical protein